MAADCPDLSVEQMLSPIELARATDSRFIPGRHFSLLEYEFLETIQPGGWDVLIAMAPPRHGKSYFLSRLVPTWYHSVYPYSRSIMCSYALSLVRNASRHVRNMVDYLAPAYQNGGVSIEARSASDWLMANQIGGCRAAGVGGGITGVGGDLIIIDDYLKNAQQAMNPNIREAQWEWFQSTCFSRLEPGGKLVCLACLAGDSSIWMADGTRKPIKEIVVGDRVISYSGGRQVVRTVTNAACVGDDAVYEMVIGSKRVKCNARHPWLIERKGFREWVKTRDLISEKTGKAKAGVRVVTCGVVGLQVGTRLKLDQAWLLGNMFGDGWLTIRDTKQKCFKVRNKKRELIGEYARRGFVTCWAHGQNRDIEKRWLKALRDNFKVTPKRTRYGYYRTEVQRVGKWFFENGLFGNAKTKRIPSWVFSEPIEIRRSFLAGFVDADGFACRRRGIDVGYGVKLANEGLTKDIKQLADSCGHNTTRISHGKTVNKPPNSKGSIESEYWSFSWSTCKDTTSMFRSEALRSVELSGVEPVYDIEVEGDHNFIAEGIVSHNTRWHDDDLIGRLLNFLLKEKGAGALRVREVRLPALSEGLGDPLGRAEGEALWPEKISAEWLGKIQAVNEGYWWNALYQQRTGAHHGNEWPESYFYGIMAEESEWPKKTCRLGAIALDPSKGKNARKGDYQAIVYVGFADGYLWVDAEIERRPVPETIQTMIEMEGDYRPTVSGIEAVAFQELLAPIYAAECAKQGRAYLEPELIDNTVNKHIRIARLGSWLRLHMIKIRRTRGGYLLRNMLKEYPNHSHDDGPDALEMAIRLLVSLSAELEHISQLSIV